MAVVAIMACVIIGAMVERASSAELVRLRPGEIDLLAKVVASEARGESDRGQRAIAWVALNRLDAAPEFGRSLTRVLLAPHQFAKPAPIADTSPAYWRAMHATTAALLGIGEDPSLGSTHFFRKDMRPWPAWARHLEQRIVIGRHVFLRPVD
jgi:N-acetylmuramoyl-L-alanine amidase